MIKISNLTVKYDKKTIIENLNLSFDEESLTAIIGPNGSGKTTLIKSIMSFIKYDGLIQLDDEDIKKLPLRRKKTLLSYVAQDTDAFYNFTVFEFIAMGVLGYQDFFAGKSKYENKVNEVLETFDLLDFKDRRINELSGGEKRLCYLARCYAQSAKWMILDEPTASLDIKNENFILSKLKSIKNTQNNGIILSIHNPLFALLYADRIIAIDKGKIVGDYLNNQENKEDIINMLHDLYGDIIDNFSDVKEKEKC